MVVLAVTLVAFVIFFVLPSHGPGRRVRRAQPHAGARRRRSARQLGLDKPVPVQYGLYVKRLVLGDEYGWPGLGLSYNTRSPDAGTRSSNDSSITLQIAIGGAILWLLIGHPDRDALGPQDDARSPTGPRWASR